MNTTTRFTTPLTFMLVALVQPPTQFHIQVLNGSLKGLTNYPSVLLRVGWRRP
jgi:hypothetical protein